MAREPQRIAKLLARAGVASRREVERMIAEGRVAVAGTVIDTPATLLETLHQVTVDGNPVRAAAPARLFRFHKPAGLLTTERDPQGRPTIYDRLPQDLPRLVPVGRLDLNTEGLLLLTTDGGLKRQLELPSTGVERSYRARAFGDISQHQLEELIHGIEIEGIRYGQIDANLERRTGRNQWIEMRLTEGKNREVRRVLEHLGLQVSRLIRTAYGPFHLADLAPGQIEEVRQHDLVAFRRVLDGKPPLPAVDGAGAGERPRRTAHAPDGRRERPAPRGKVEERGDERPARESRPLPHDRTPSRRTGPPDRQGGPRERARSGESSARPDRGRTGERDAAPGGRRASRRAGSSERVPQGDQRGAKAYGATGRADREPRVTADEDSSRGRPPRGAAQSPRGRSKEVGPKRHGASARKETAPPAIGEERTSRTGSPRARPSAHGTPSPRKAGGKPGRDRTSPSTRTDGRRGGAPRGRGGSDRPERPTRRR